MGPADRKEFATLVQTLGAAFGVEPSAPMLEAYWLALEDLGIAEVRRMVGAALRGGERMPPPATLRKLGGESQATAALDAWQAVVEAIRKHGHYRSVDFGPVVNTVVRQLGGWRQICATESDQLHNFVRREFERIYLATAQRPVEHLSTSPLLGEFAHQGVVRVAIGATASRPQLESAKRPELPPS